jgi:predicted Zn-dependent peptidase
MLDQVLHGGRAGRLHRVLVNETQVAVDVAGGIHYPMGDVLDYNGPMLMVTSVVHKPEISSEETLAAFDAVVRDVQERGVSAQELEQVKMKFRSDYFSTLETGMGSSVPRFGLMHYLACFTLFDGEPQLVNNILDGFLEVTPQRAQTAAQNILVPRNRSIVFRRPVQQEAA